jgi:uncharacterized protein (DUF885 family)
MPDITSSSERPGPRPVRDVADRYVLALADLNPILATGLGLDPHEDRLPDLSPAGQQAIDDLSRATLAELDTVKHAAGATGATGATGAAAGGAGAGAGAGTGAAGTGAGAGAGAAAGGAGAGAGAAAEAAGAGGSAGAGDSAGAGGSAGAGAGAGTGAEAAAGFASGDERRCARLLRERLDAGLAMSGAGEHLRALSAIFGPVQRVRGVFLLMPAATDDDWAAIGRRMARVGQALAGYRASLAEGARRGLLAAPRQVRTVADQLAEWTAAAGGHGWFAEFAAGASVPPALRADLDAAAAAATAAVDELRRWLTSDYLSRAAGTPDGVGAERYRVSARFWTGGGVDPAEAYAWGWSQYQSLWAEMRGEAQQVLAGASVRDAMRHLDTHGEAVQGVEQIRLRLQQLMDRVIADLNGTHFDLAARLQTVEARIAPPGSAAAPYYTPPSQDFSRPGRTWLPTLGRTRFPLWNLVSTWHHEGVPGHHLQLAQWRHLSSQLSTYQTTIGNVSACSEGWALYAERLMDELGYLSDPGQRLGYLGAQMSRAIRVVVDIGMHLARRVPADSPLGAGETWTPELARDFFLAHTGHDRAFIDSEIARYLSAPGQAISYKLGERAWLRGRDAARAARGPGFDLKSWHMAALSLGSLGLDDLADELAAL